MLTLLYWIWTANITAAAVIDCSGEYEVNSKPTNTYYTMPNVRFFSDDLLMVTWSHNRTVSQEYRFYTIKPYANAINTILDNQYADTPYLNKWFDQDHNLTASYDKALNKIYIRRFYAVLSSRRAEMGFIHQTVDIPSNSINIINTVTLQNITLDVINTNLTYNSYYFHPSLPEYVAIFHHTTSLNTISFFIGDATQYTDSSDQIQFHSASLAAPFDYIFYGSIKLCFSSDRFIITALAKNSSAPVERYYLVGISFKLNGVSLVSPFKKIPSTQMLNNSHPGGMNHPICKTRNDGLILLCYETPPFPTGAGSDIGCNLVDPNTLNSLYEQTFASDNTLMEQLPQVAIYPNNQFVLCYNKPYGGGQFCLMSDAHFNIIVTERQITTESGPQKDAYFKLAQVSYGKQYRFIMVWQRSDDYNKTLGTQNNYDFVKMIICQDSDQTLSPTAYPTEYPTALPSVYPSAYPTNSPIVTTAIREETTATTMGDINEDWIVKESLNCPEGFMDLDEENDWNGVYCQKCPDGTAGTYGICEQCGTLEEPNQSRTECEFVHPWWLYIIEVLTGFGFVGTIGTFSYRLYKKNKSKKSNSLIPPRERTAEMQMLTS
eukprot:511331_1